MECLPPNMATPMNTLGMGGVSFETDPCVPKIKSKRLVSLKDYIKKRKQKQQKMGAE
jgi:hypothetical protein